MFRLRYCPHVGDTLKTALLGALVGAVLFASAAPALGAPQRDWTGTVEVVTDFPLQLGAAFRVEAPGGFQVSSSVGVLPMGYVDVINALATTTGAYQQETAELVRESLRESLVLKLNVGYRPFKGEGFYLDAGYGLVTLGSLVRGPTIMGIPDPRFQEVITNLEQQTGLNMDSVMAANRYKIDSTLHMLNAEVGYRLRFGQDWTARFALGAAFTIYGVTSVSARNAYVGEGWRTEYNDELMDSTRRYLDSLYTQSVHTIILTVALGHRLF